uniref:Uncharacterized protein n=1 Tax=Arion vulgaris TaxID=1028688 RepID=A0A0B7AMY9_9EUPU
MSHVEKDYKQLVRQICVMSMYVGPTGRKYGLPSKAVLDTKDDFKHFLVHLSHLCCDLLTDRRI